MTRTPQWVIDAGENVKRQMAEAQEAGLEALLNFKVSNTPSGTRQTTRTPGPPDPHNKKETAP
jgi:hypothetical protein